MYNYQDTAIDLSIIIKTLNEENNIARCIEAILNVKYEIKIEIIVADSGSSDRTIDIAATYPVTIVQLVDPQERSCGIGPQLGYQHSNGKYILILDADMVLHPAFVRTALLRLAADSSCAGIGGQLVECSGSGYEYDLRRSLARTQEEEVNWLDGGGLYRREAILSVGYLSNRNLHAYEEKELGLRLRYAGWRMFRLADIAVDHYGHSMDSIALLWRRWRTGYANACGESIRACFGKPYLKDMVLAHKTLVICLIFQFFFIVSIAFLPWTAMPFIVVGGLILIGSIVQIILKKSIHAAANSLIYTNIFALGLALGMLKKQRNPSNTIQSLIVKKSTISAL